MNRQKQDFLTRFHLDLTLLCIVFVIFTFGLFVLYSASGQNINIIIKQTTAFGIGLISMIIIARINPLIFSKLSLLFYFFVIGLLVWTIFFGQTRMGATRWISVGFFSFQSSELAKIAVPLLLAHFLANRNLPPNFTTIGIAIVCVAIPCLLILKQPDLGTAILILIGGFCVLFIAGLSWKILIFFSTCSIPALFFLWDLLHDYQKKRILTFINPETDIQGAGWNITQSKIAIGSGGLLGKGWLEGTQSHLKFLPEGHTDFIIAVLSEEFGFIGVLLLLFLYSILLLRAIVIALRARTLFDHLLASTIACIIGFYIFINMGMVSGILPVVGVPLPFISNGGTQVIIMLSMVGMLMSINANREIHI
jgi:rod shape determining protein RodA